MFPLPGLFLFPHQLLPLHIFEPRYRRLVEDSLDGPGRLVIATAQGGEEQGPPPVLTVAGMGEIARHDKLPDGRFDLIVHGLWRARVEELPSERPYRRVRATPLDEVPPSRAASERLRRPLYAALRRRAAAAEELPPDLPTTLATDLLAVRLDVPQWVMEEIYRERDVQRRAELALAAHASYPPPE